LDLRFGDEDAVQCKCSLYVSNIQQSIAKIHMTHFAPGPGQATVGNSLACDNTDDQQNRTVPPGTSCFLHM
jgi:hypothetical protein